MKTAIVQCPNTECGRVLHLGDDPLGRVFRCPYCLTKLPTAPVSAADRSPGYQIDRRVSIALDALDDKQKRAVGGVLTDRAHFIASTADSRKVR
ncbi:MAG: BRcat domain-containing protein, partial [Isosphaerales bacterium]